MKRNVIEYKTEGKNSLRYVCEHIKIYRSILNFILMWLSTYCFIFQLKNFLLRLSGMKIGQNVSVGRDVVFDRLFPEYTEIGENSIIGFNTTILCHEYLINSYRIGNVVIGKNVLIGANCTVLPGVTIGDNVTVSACTLVNRDIPDNTFCGGIPVKIIKQNIKNEDSGVLVCSVL